MVQKESMNIESHKTTEKKLLYEVSLIRPFVIFLLVVMHSFTKIAEGGLRSNTYQLPEIYQWLCHLISGFRIEKLHWSLVMSSLIKVSTYIANMN